MVQEPVCPSCGAAVALGGRFCSACGTVLAVSCPRCSAEASLGAQFCSSCGHRLDLAAPREEERKLVTVLFADLTGSTTLGERLDPERLRSLLADYFAAMAFVVEAWGGTVEKFVGDAVMAVFGTPVMHEDDAQRALHAALDMQARLSELNPAVEERYGVRLAMRVGVNTGEVIAGTGGDQLMVTGDAVNVAARLQQAAEPGEVVVGERTYLAARSAFAFERLEVKALRGKAVAVPAWRLVGPHEAQARRGVAGLSAPLVGRQRELSMLEAVYRAAVEEARPRLVTIVGQAGVGKTRLLEEFLARVSSGNGEAAVYRGRCLPYGQGITYWALREILWNAAGILLGDSSTVAGEKLRRLVGELLARAGADPAEAERVTFALATTAGISLPGNPLEQMSPESIGEELGLAWPRFVSALAAERPGVVVVEDVHRAEPPLLDMLEHLVSRSTQGVLVIATARPELAEVRPAWTSRPGVSQIGLEPLSEADAHELLSQLVPGIGPQLRDKVASAAEGNPFFAEEIVAHLIDEGILEAQDGSIVEARTEAAVTIPDTVRALLAARVDALPPEEKRTLQDAAVVGRVFWAAPLAATRPDARVRQALQALEDKGLVVARPTSALPGHAELAFRHGLTREVAYQSIPKARRARVHAEVGRWIEELAGDRREEYLELLAYHYEAAARPEDAELAWQDDAPAREDVRAKAFAALIDAGHAARTRFAIDQALGFGERALALAANDAERLAAVELEAEAGHAGVRADEAWESYMEALQIAKHLGDAESAGTLRANATLLWARYFGAFSRDDWKERAVEVVREGLEEAGEDSVTFVTGALLCGRALFGSLKLAPHTSGEARRDAERAVEIAETIGSEFLMSHALDGLGGVTEMEGFCRASEVAEQTLRVGRSMADRWNAHELLVTSAIAFADAGRFDEAAAVAQDAARQALELSPHHRLHGASAQTSALLGAGRLAELADATADVVDLVVAEGEHTCFHGFFGLAGRTLAAFEAEDAAETARSLELLRTAGPDRPSRVGYEGRIGEVLRPVLGVDEIRRWVEERMGGEYVAARVRELRCELRVRALSGEWEQFALLAAEARALAASACAPYLHWLVDWGEALRLAMDGGSAAALARAREATSSLAGYGERYTAARLLVDLLPFLEREAARELAGEVAERLEPMGARGSAAEARAVAG